MTSRRTGLAILVIAILLLFFLIPFVPRIPQPLAYHNFADQRSWLGISNFGNVVSNIPFAVFGLMGLSFLLGSNSSKFFLNPRERIPWFFFFLGLFLTAFGSGYYHWHPDNSNLVWDRLTMTIVFTSLIAAFLAERFSVRAGLFALAPLLFLGAASVFYWHFTELHSRGDLRFYFCVQACCFLVLLFSAFLLHSHYTRTGDLAVAAAFYFAAVLLEQFDHPVYSAFGHLVSGHTLKHLSASLAGYWLLRMLRLRRPLNQP